MDLKLSDKTVLLYGSGDYLDQVIVHSLAEEGARVLAATTQEPTELLLPPASGKGHWTSHEESFDESVGERLSAFLREQQQQPSAVVAHIDVEALAGELPSARWWRSRSSETEIMLGMLRAVIAAIPDEGSCNIVFVYQLQRHGDEIGAYRWLEAAMTTIVHRADADNIPSIRVNSLMVGHDDAFPESGDLVTYLCSPRAQRVSGSFITVDDGLMLRRT
jgi:NAD(P)-dependent dehydrogenase (short-subunit alcohol dehydrogenase family)